MQIETDGAINLGTNGANNGFLNGEGWWAIILFAMIFGWGRNGYGGNGDGSGASANYVLASDFATIQRQLSDGFGDLTSQSRYIQNGICDGFYAMNTSLLNGFNGINQNIMTSGYETRNAINGVSSQLASCCCDIRSGIKDTQYAIATQTNAINQSLCSGFRDVIDNQNANARSILDFLVKDKIETLTSENSALRLKASQAEQSNYIISQVRPTPTPSYNVPNPYCCNTYTTCGSTM